jgi:dihydroxy-acid dehydratase
VSTPLRETFDQLVPGYAAYAVPNREITADEGFPAAEAMLSAVMTNQDIDPRRISDVASVVVFGVAYDGNSCNMKVEADTRRVRKAISAHESGKMYGSAAFEVGTSDGITMGHSDMGLSLPSREHIANGVEIAAQPRQHVGLVAIGACDKNYPGIVMGAARVDKPFYMINGGTIMPGEDKKGAPLDVVSAFQAAGEFRAGKISKEERDDKIQGAIPGAGACGGMYTANTMTSAIEALGLMIPGTASIPAVSSEKTAELRLAGDMMYSLLSKDLTPGKIVTKASFENAITVAIALGGSTNIVLHGIAMAKEFGIDLTYDDIQKISDRTPVLADMKPSGKYYMSDLHEAGGVPAVMRHLGEGLIDMDAMTVTGRSVGENLDVFSDLADGQKVILPVETPIKPEGHIQILHGNIAPEGGVAKITGNNAATGLTTGEALVCDSEREAIEAFDKDPESFKGKVIVIRNVGIKGAPGMPEMLAITSRISGAGLDEDCALITDGRFSGGTHGFCVGHIEPEAYRGGPIGLLRNGDKISIDVREGRNSINAEVTEAEFAERRETWERVVAPTIGFLAAYRTLAGPAHHGAVSVFER